MSLTHYKGMRGYHGIIEAQSGFLKDMDIDGSLEMGNDGKISNIDGDYAITENGMSIQTTTGALDEPRALSFHNGTTLEAAIWAPESYQLSIEAIGEGHNILLHADGEVVVSAKGLRLPIHDNASRPTVTNSDAGLMIYNTDADQPQVVDNSGDWRGVDIRG